MAERITLGLFGGTLALCIVLDAPLVLALLCGLVYFCGYALRCGHSPSAILDFIIQGIKNARVILCIFVIVGTLTALWRACGTIPYLITYTVPLIPVTFFVPCIFLLCCAMSFLTGSSFGSVSTMGVVCMTIGRTLDLPLWLLGGAILSGVFFGDRSSPVSSSAHLVCQLTDTDIYSNLKGMFRTCLVPFAISLALFTLVGMQGGGGSFDTEVLTLFSRHFRSSPWLLLPAILILALSALRKPILITMGSSALAAAILAVAVQGVTPAELISCVLWGYQAPDPQLARLLDGGGIFSMISTGSIVAISSAYFGIFQNTHLLDDIKDWMGALARRTTPFFSAMVTSILTGALSCNQTLSTMLTSEVIRPEYPDNTKWAMALENSIILISALIPWSIACSFPLAVLGAPDVSLLWAVYLYAVPLWNLLVSIREKAAKR